MPKPNEYQPPTFEPEKMTKIGLSVLSETLRSAPNDAPSHVRPGLSITGAGGFNVLDFAQTAIVDSLALQRVGNSALARDLARQSGRAQELLLAGGKPAGLYRPPGPTYRVLDGVVHILPLDVSRIASNEGKPMPLGFGMTAYYVGTLSSSGLRSDLVSPEDASFGIELDYVWGPQGRLHRFLGPKASVGRAAGQVAAALRASRKVGTLIDTWARGSVMHPHRRDRSK